MSIVRITNELRFERRVVKQSETDAMHQVVLQQAWADLHTGAITWRDVPTVDAAPTPEPRHDDA